MSSRQPATRSSALRSRHSHHPARFNPIQRPRQSATPSPTTRYSAALPSTLHPLPSATLLQTLHTLRLATTIHPSYLSLYNTLPSSTYFLWPNTHSPYMYAGRLQSHPYSVNAIPSHTPYTHDTWQHLLSPSIHNTLQHPLLPSCHDGTVQHAQHSHSHNTNDDTLQHAHPPCTRDIRQYAGAPCIQDFWQHAQAPSIHDFLTHDTSYRTHPSSTHVTCQHAQPPGTQDS